MKEKDFVEQLKKIIKLYKKDNNFSKAIEIWTDDTWITVGGEWLDIALKLLAQLVGDKYETLEYWFYELERGTKWEEGKVTDTDGKDIKIKTIHDLYLLIKKESK